MARREIVVVTDDLDGSDVDIRTVSFGFEGRHYEVDLGPDNYKQLTEALAPFIAAARRAPGSRSGTPPPAGPPTNAEIREWLKTHGYAGQVTDRGRIAKHLLDAYTASRIA
jgi:hypothetical protein